MLLENILFFALSVLFLIASGIFLVKALTRISHFLKIPEFSASFILMAIATSIPELFVGISSATSGSPELSLGNVLGAGILNLTLISGIFILSNKEIKIKNRKIGKDVYFMLVSILLIIFLYVIGKSLSRTDGIVLLFFFIFNIARKLRKSKKYTKKFKKRINRKGIAFSFLIFIPALIILFISSQYVVKYGSAIAIDLNLPKLVLGLFLLSVATTLPELTFSISAGSLKHKEMGLGDLIGAVVTNCTLVLGIVSVIHPIQTNFLGFITSAIFLFISAFIFTTFLKTGKKLEKIEGISLILIYLLFVTIELFIR